MFVFEGLPNGELRVRGHAQIRDAHPKGGSLAFGSSWQALPATTPLLGAHPEKLPTGAGKSKPARSRAMLSNSKPETCITWPMMSTRATCAAVPNASHRDQAVRTVAIQWRSH